MEFKSRISYNFISKVLVAIIALCIAIFGVFKTSYISEGFVFIYIAVFFIVILRLIMYRRYIYLHFFKKPVLVIDESYIYDVVAGIKYYLKDIDFVYENNAYLYIKLHYPAEYLNKIGDPIKRFILNVDYEPNAKETPYKINLDFVKVDLNVLLELLDDFTIKATQAEIHTGKSGDAITFNFKWGRTLNLRVFQLTLFSLIMIVYAFGSHKDYTIAFIYMFTLVTLTPGLIKAFVYSGQKKSTLSANGSFIFDQYKNIKYYWADIEEINVSDDFLFVKLFEPEKYIRDVKNPFSKFFKRAGYYLFKIRPSYSINMNIIDVKKEEKTKFLDMLNEFSMAATE